MTARIYAIYRYPVKGLTPQPLERTTLVLGATLPADRLYAIENGPCGFDPAAPQYFPKLRFLMLMRNERLAALHTDYDEASHTLTIGHEGREAARGLAALMTDRQCVTSLIIVRVQGCKPLIAHQHQESQLGKILRRGWIEAARSVLDGVKPVGRQRGAQDKGRAL